LVDDGIVRAVLVDGRCVVIIQAFDPHQ
jgi:hypothetical protein